MSDCLNFNTEEKINPYYDDSRIDISAAEAEHQQVKRLLEESGCEVISVSSPSGSQDGVYTANWALVRGKKAVMANLPNTRKAEEPYAAQVLADMGYEVIKLDEGLRFSGQGDALPCGDLLFCGSGYRSDTEAQKIVADTLGFKCVQLRTIPQLNENGKEQINSATGWVDSFFYDIDLALAILKHPNEDQKGLIAYCPEAFMPESQQKIAELTEVDKIIVSLEEAMEGFACNLVSTGEHVVMSAKAPNLAENIRQAGLVVHTPEITELAKGGGYIRCVTLTLE